MLSVAIDQSAMQRLIQLGGDLPKALRNGILRAMILAQQNIGRQIGPGGVLTARSGGLAKSWRVVSAAKADGFSAQGTIGSDHPAASIQNDGGTILPKTAKYLSIPLDAAKTSSGVARWASPRQVAGLFPIRSKAGNLLLVRRIGSGKHARIEPMFVLKSSVTLKATHYADLAAEKTEPEIPVLINAAIEEAIQAMEEKESKS